MLLGRLDKWAMLLAPFGIKFIPQKAVKGQAIADFLAAYPYTNNEELPDDLPDDKVMLAEIKLGSYILMGHQGLGEPE